MGKALIVCPVSLIAVCASLSASEVWISKKIQELEKRNSQMVRYKIDILEYTLIVVSIGSEGIELGS